MRAFGPGSVSSLLKAVLDVMVYAVWAAGALVALTFLAALLAQPFIGAVTDTGALGDLIHLLRRGPALLLLLAAMGLWLGALGVVVDRLRRLFATMIAGRPFQPQNVERLRVIGLALIGLEITGYVLPALAAPVLGGNIHARRDGDLSSGFAILVVFVLAEVFREGARLQAEAELTV